MRSLPSPLNWARRLHGGGVTAAVTVTSSPLPRRDDLGNRASRISRRASPTSKMACPSNW